MKISLAIGLTVGLSAMAMSEPAHAWPTPNEECGPGNSGAMTTVTQMQGQHEYNYIYYCNGSEWMLQDILVCGVPRYGCVYL